MSQETRVIQAKANAWHEQQGRSLAAGDSYRWAPRRPSLLLFLVGVVSMNLILVPATTLAVLAVVLFALSRRVRIRIGIPAGEIFYQDLDGQPFQAEVLRSSLWGISGKPDCLIRTAAGVIPLEYKRSNKAPARGGIYPNHGLLCQTRNETSVPGN